MLNIPNLATKWGHIFGGVNQIDTFRGTTLKTRADTIAADYTTAAEQRLAADGLYSQFQSVDDNLDSTLTFLFTMAKNTLIVASINDSDFPIATDDDTLLAKLVRDMVAQAQTFQLPTVTASGAPGAAASPVTTLEGAPYGTGIIIVSVVEPRTGKVKYYAYPEVMRFICTADSYQDGATAGQETFTVQGYSSTDVLDSLWPKGSGVNTTFQSQPSKVGTLISNAYFDNWDAVTPNTLLSWTLNNLTPGTNFFQANDPYVGLYAVRLTAAPLNGELTQVVNGLQGAKNYLAALRLKRVTAVTAGVITVALRDVTGAILNDALGVPMSFTINLAGGAGSYFLTWLVFSVPNGFPSQVFFSIKVTTAMNPAESVDLATSELIPMNTAYVGGPDFAFLPGDKAWSRNDTYASTIANNATKASFVRVMDRLYNTRARQIDLPVAAIPTISDALIV